MNGVIDVIVTYYNNEWSELERVHQMFGLATAIPFAVDCAMCDNTLRVNICDHYTGEVYMTLNQGGDVEYLADVEPEQVF